MVSVACLTVGSRVAYDGGVWTVVALAGDLVTVREQRLGRALALRIASLVAAAGSGLIECGVAAPAGAVGPELASLAAGELALVCERAAHVREVLRISLARKKSRWRSSSIWAQRSGPITAPGRSF